MRDFLIEIDMEIQAFAGVLKDCRRNPLENSVRINDTYNFIQHLKGLRDVYILQHGEKEDVPKAHNCIPDFEFTEFGIGVGYFKVK